MRTRWRRGRHEFSPVVRQAALRRAYYRCEKCESKERLEIHHIGNRQDRSAFNAQVLCVPCHSKLHRDRGKRSQNHPQAWSGPLRR